MKKKAVFIILVLLLNFSLMRLLIFHVEANAGTVRVPQDFLSIQQAIDASLPGGTVLVAPGTYHENITVWKPLTVKGQSTESTIIDQVAAYAVCHVKADNVVLTGFTIESGSVGVWIQDSNDSVITTNVIVNNDDGMWVTSSYGSIISNNSITDNLFMGAYLSYSNGTTLNNNTITGNTYGIYAQNSEYNSLYGNNVLLNYGDGIRATNSNHNVITRNMIGNNSYGLHLKGLGTVNNNISENRIVENDLYGISVEGCSSNRVYHNDFLNNTNQVQIYDSTGVWDNGYPSGGNYWSDYTGSDIYSGPYQDQPGKDWIGDTPYSCSGSEQDRYPLMTTWTNIAVQSVSPSKTIVGQGQSVNISVSVQNQGWDPQTVNLTVYANTTVVSTFENVALAGGNQTTLTFTWETSTFLRGNYTISAHADPVSGELNTGDNALAYDRIAVMITGDINADGTVNILDAIVMSNNFLLTVNSPDWNPNADINNDGTVNILDAIILANNFGKTGP